MTYFPSIHQQKNWYGQKQRAQERPVDLNGISSFTYKVRSFIENSNLLNPSNCELRKFEDRGSLKETLNGIDIFDRVEKKGWMHLAGKPIRAAARSLLFVSGSSLAAPLGVIWNGTLTVYHIGRWAFSTKDTMQCKEHGEKIAAYAHSFFIDLGVSFILLGAHLVIAGGILSGELAGWAMAAFMGLVASYPAINLPGTINCFVFEEHCGPAYAALKLKNDYGIVGLDGSVLKFDPRLDEEKTRGEGLVKTMVILGFDRFLNTLEDLQLNLPKDCKLKDIYPPTADAIIACLERNRSKIEAQKSPLWLDGEIQLIKQRYREFDELYDAYIAILKMRIEGNPIFNALANKHVNTNLIRKEHLFTKENFKNFLTNAANPQVKRVEKDEFEDCRESVHNLLNGKKLETEGLPEFYKVVRANILNTKVTEPYQIFGLEKMPESRLEAKALMRHFPAISPDRIILLKKELKEEATEIYKCVLAAHRKLLKEFPE